MVYTALRRALDRRLRSGVADRGDIVLGWLSRVVVGVAVAGVLVFEVIALVTARVQGTDVANQVAMEASEAYLAKGSLKAAYAAADAEAVKHAAEIVPESLTAQKDGRIKLRLRRTATTLLLYRTKSTAKWTVIVSEGNARSAPS